MDIFYTYGLSEPAFLYVDPLEGARLLFESSESESESFPPFLLNFLLKNQVIWYKPFGKYLALLKNDAAVSSAKTGAG